MSKTIVHLPSPRQIARHAIPHLLESTVGPALLFYAVLMLLGARGALFAALGWSYAAVLRRVLTGRRLPGILLIASALLTARTAISLATGSTFIYFLQPTLGTFLVAAAFLVSVPLGRPLAERLAKDFCPLDTDLLARRSVQRFFLRVSLLWTVALLINAGVTLWMLMTWPVSSFVVSKTLVWLLVTGCGIVVSVLWFRRAMSVEGLSIRWATLVKPARGEIASDTSG